MTLNASGYGTIRFGPGRHGIRWDIRRITVNTSTDTAIPEAKVYRGSVGPGTFISGTFVGSQDQDDSLNESLEAGEYLTVEWSGGDPASIATATWTGSEVTGE